MVGSARLAASVDVGALSPGSFSGGAFSLAARSARLPRLLATAPVCQSARFALVPGPARSVGASLAIPGDGADIRFK